MKVLHVNAGLEEGGGLFHIVHLLTAAKEKNQDFTLLTFANGPVAKAARKTGIKVDVLDISSRYSLDLSKKLAQYINEHDFDIVHTHGPRANLVMSKVHKKVNAKWAITIHSDPLEDFAKRGIKGKIFEKLNTASLKKADHLLTVNRYVQSVLTDKLGIAKDKTSVICNGIFFDQDVLPKVEHTDFNLVSVARMEPVKNQTLLLRAVANLKSADVKLHFVGDGSEKGNLEELTAKLGLQDQVIFHGFLDQKEIKALYAEMDLAVLSSISEGFPLVLLEAANSSVPLLSTAVGDIDVIIPDEAHGFIAKVGDEADFTAKLKKAYELPRAELAQMGATQKDYMLHKFSIFNQLTDILNIYQKMLQK